MFDFDDPDSDYQWGPGETLPQRDRPHNEQSPLESCFTNEVRDLFQKMEDKVDTAFAEIKSKIDNIETRVSAVEQRQYCSLSSSPTSSSCEGSSDGKRKRRSQPELQVIKIMYNYECRYASK